MADERDPELPGLLLRTERDALLPLLRSAADSDFDLRTACPSWTVRDVLAHCGSVLSRVVESRFGPDVFSPECNDRDIAERTGWTHTEVVDELERGMTDAGPVIAASGGVLDAVALGEWVHAGDVRAAWGLPGAYEGPGLPHALGLLVPRALRRKVPLLVAEFTDSGRELVIGAEQDGRAPGRYRGDGATLIRLCAGRPLVGTPVRAGGRPGARTRPLRLTPGPILRSSRSRRTRGRSGRKAPGERIARACGARPTGRAPQISVRYTPARNPRSRSELPTTNTDENAIAAPAIIGFSSPIAASGSAATL